VCTKRSIQVDAIRGAIRRLCCVHRATYSVMQPCTSTAESWQSQMTLSIQESRVSRVALFVLLWSFRVVAAQAPKPAFEVATVRVAPADADPQTGSWSRPGIARFTAAHVSLMRLMQLAYGIDDSQIANKRGWMESNLYDVDAKPQEGVAMTREELKPCLQALLKERFHLATHMETRFGRGYALLVAPSGPHLKSASAGHFAGERHPVSAGHLHVYSCSMQQLAQYLTPATGFPVVNQTGLAGSYDIDFVYNPDPEAESDLPPLDLVLKQAAGLKLKPQKVPVVMLVIDSVEKVPVAN
jgi:uncharacterized protein (TIGR03435 family)